MLSQRVSVHKRLRLHVMSVQIQQTRFRVASVISARECQSSSEFRVSIEALSVLDRVAERYSCIHLDACWNGWKDPAEASVCENLVALVFVRREQ